MRTYDLYAWLRRWYDEAEERAVAEYCVIQEPWCVISVFMVCSAFSFGSWWGDALASSLSLFFVVICEPFVAIFRIVSPSPLALSSPPYGSLPFSPPSSPLPRTPLRPVRM